MYKILVLFSIVGSCYSHNSVELVEKYFKTCNIHAAHFDYCLRDAIQSGMMAMVDGIAELDIKPIDPHFEDEINVDYKAGDTISAKFYMKNIQLRGFRDTTVVNASVKVHDNHFRMEINLSIPYLSATGLYVAEGNYDSIHTSATGTFTYTMFNVTDNWMLEGVLEDKHCETYLRITSFIPTPSSKLSVTQLTNDNENSQAISGLAVQFINNNWKIFDDAFLPVGQKKWNKLGVDEANKIFQRVPYKKIFPFGFES